MKSAASSWFSSLRSSVNCSKSKINGYANEVLTEKTYQIRAQERVTVMGF